MLVLTLGDPTRSKATEGTGSTKEPRYENVVPVEELKRLVPRIVELSLFPREYLDQGNQPTMIVDCDAMEFPNAVLAELQVEILDVLSPDGDSVMRAVDPGSRASLPVTPGRSHGGNMALPIQKGTPAEALSTARMRFDIKVPVLLASVEFTPDDVGTTISTSRAVQVTLDELDNDVAGVTVRGGKPVRLTAYDARGRALDRLQMFTAGVGMTARFAGRIDRLRALVVAQTLEYSFTLDVDLNKGQPLRLSRRPETPSRWRYDPDRFIPHSPLTDSDRERLAVRWLNPAPAAVRSQKRLAISLPRDAIPVRARWEVHAFGAANPIPVSGNSVRTDRELGYAFSDATPGRVDPEPHAVFGRVNLRAYVALEKLAFPKSGEGGTVVRKLKTGKEVSVTYNLNEIQINAPGVVMLQRAAYDASGRRLHEDPFLRSGPRGSIIRYYWGIPAAVGLEVAGRTIRQTVAFEHIIDEVDRPALDAYKRDIEVHRDVVAALKQIRRAQGRNRSGYRNDIAGLHYIHNSEGVPIRLVSEQFAHASPAGAQRFGYTTTPYKGYTFALLAGTTRDGEPLDYKRRREQTFKWDHGELVLRPLVRLPDCMAVPGDAAQPTFLASRGNVYAKRLEGMKTQYRPELLKEHGWTKIEFVDDESKKLLRYGRKKLGGP